jgi:hypothetical protein
MNVTFNLSSAKSRVFAALAPLPEAGFDARPGTGRFLGVRLLRSGFSLSGRSLPATCLFACSDGELWVVFCFLLVPYFAVCAARLDRGPTYEIFRSTVREE